MGILRGGVQARGRVGHRDNKSRADEPSAGEPRADANFGVEQTQSDDENEADK